MNASISVLTAQEIESLHKASVRVLETTGMKIECEELLIGLEGRGARVDYSARTVRFPPALVEDALKNNAALIRSGFMQHLLNGVTSEKTDTPGMAAKVSGGCELHLDWSSQSLSEPDAATLLDFVRIGELLPEVTFVGNPVVLRTDLNGNKIDERMRRIQTAALVAKNTRKVGSMEVWDEAEIDFMIEIGAVVRGSEEEYRRNPCLVTAKETISPLFLDEKSGSILLAFAKRGLPCTIIPMPISGLSAPATTLGGVVVGNAEIIGVMTAIFACVPEAVTGGGSIAGVVDMQTGTVSFSAPEAVLQDIAIAEIHEKRYGFNYLIGSGYTDAKYPNHQVLAEKAMNYLFAELSGRNSHPVGLLNAGSVFSAEQALVDIELCRNAQAHLHRSESASDIDTLVEVIDSVGVRGNFLDSDHTLKHFRENWFPALFDRSGFRSIEESKSKDIYANARNRVVGMLSGKEFWSVDSAAAHEIDRIVAGAEKALQQGD